MAALDLTTLVVLVVEDNEFIRLMLRKYLGDFGFRKIFEAADGTEAIKLLDKKPDIIICDIHMEPMDGFGFVKHIRALEAPANKVPVIFLTGDAHVDQVQGAIDLAVDAYLLKPVTPENLKSRILALLTRKS